MNISSAFAEVLREVRIKKGLTQEDFVESSGRTYISELERGIKKPTLEKIDAIAGQMEVQPLTMIAMVYDKIDPELSIDELLNTIRKEIDALYDLN